MKLDEILYIFIFFFFFYLSKETGRLFKITNFIVFVYEKFQCD